MFLEVGTLLLKADVGCLEGEFGTMSIRTPRLPVSHIIYIYIFMTYYGKPWEAVLGSVSMQLKESSSIHVGALRWFLL